MHKVFFLTSGLFVSSSLSYDTFGTKQVGHNELGIMRGGRIWASSKTPCAIWDV